MRRDIVAAIAKTDRAIKRHCTGDPNTCGKSYSVPTQADIPLCGILGGECDRGQYRDELIAKRR